MGGGEKVCGCEVVVDGGVSLWCVGVRLWWAGVRRCGCEVVVDGDVRLWCVGVRLWWVGCEVVVAGGEVVVCGCEKVCGVEV